MTPLHLTFLVELHLLELQARGVTDADLERARGAGELLATHGDAVEFGGASRAERRAATHTRSEVAFAVAVTLLTVPGARERLVSAGVLQ